MEIPHYAILSGLFGTAASVFGKFISYSDEVIENLTIDSSRNVCKNFFVFRCIECRRRCNQEFIFIGISTAMVVKNYLYYFDDTLQCVRMDILCESASSAWINCSHSV